MSAYEDGREYDVNDTLSAGGVTYVVTAVSHQVDDATNQKHSFQYTIRNKDEADAEAAATRQAEIEAKNAQESTDLAEATRIASEAEQAKVGAVDVDDKEAVDAAHEAFEGELSTNEPQAETVGKEPAVEADKLPSLEAN